VLQVPTADLTDCRDDIRIDAPAAAAVVSRDLSSDLTQTKQGISSIELGRRLGVTQTTAWKLKHRLKQVMLERDATKRLTGRVEIDDAYLGGERHGASEAAGRPARRRSSPLSRQPRRESRFG
jgi:hypothetical protein